MVVSGQISCNFLSVQYFLFLDMTSRSVGTRVVYIFSGLCLLYFSAFILIYVLLRLVLRLVGVYLCYLYVFEEMDVPGGSACSIYTFLDLVFFISWHIRQHG